jgi:hypothetical protein
MDFGYALDDLNSCGRFSSFRTYQLNNSGEVREPKKLEQCGVDAAW